MYIVFRFGARLPGEAAIAWGVADRLCCWIVPWQPRLRAGRVAVPVPVAREVLLDRLPAADMRRRHLVQTFAERRSCAIFRLDCDKVASFVG